MARNKKVKDAGSDHTVDAHGGDHPLIHLIPPSRQQQRDQPHKRPRDGGLRPAMKTARRKTRLSSG
eukprot:scaffold29867_cov29-Prasinocladus_malaysianus.AAC.1